MKVICIKQHSRGVLTVGKIYEVSGTITCCQVAFDVGIRINHRGSYCEFCGYKTDGKIAWISSTLFAPLEEKGEMFIEEFLVAEGQNVKELK